MVCKVLNGKNTANDCDDGFNFGNLVYCMLSYCCCVWIGTVCSTVVSCNYNCELVCGSELQVWPTLRLGLSFMEITTIVIFGIIDYNDSDSYLFWLPNSGLVVFFITIGAYCVDCCYLRLYPNFTLNNDVRARSKCGLAFAGELKSLQHIGFGKKDMEMEP